MNEAAAKTLVKDLKKRANAHFAFAPNGKNPVLLVGKRAWTPALVKTASEEAGVVFKGGALYVGDVEREGKVITLRCDPDRSKGNVNAKKALLGLRTLRKSFQKVGAKVGWLKTLQFQIGDQPPEADDPDEEATDVRFGLLLPPWDERMSRVEARLDMLEALAPGEDPPGNRTADELRAKLGQVTRDVRDDMKLKMDGASEVPATARKALKALFVRVDDALNRIDAGRAARRAAWDREFTPVPAVEVSTALGNDLAERLARFNERLTGGGKSAKELASSAYDLAQHCLTLRDEIAGLSKKKRRARQAELDALITLQHRAVEIADAVEVEAAMAERGGEIGALLADGDRQLAGAGINGALLLKEGEEIRFVAKIAPVTPEKLVELSSEVICSEIADVFCGQLGLPQLVSTTTSSIQQIHCDDDGKPVGADEDGTLQDRIVCVQDAWERVGDLDDGKYLYFTFQGTEHKLSTASVMKAGQEKIAIDEVRLANGRAIDGTDDDGWDPAPRYTWELMDELGIDRVHTEELHNELGLTGTNTQKYWVRPEVPREVMVEDLASIAVVDLITGQADHVAGKEDNVIQVTIEGETRLRPIDFGMALVPLSEWAVKPHDAWSMMPEATGPMPPEMLASLVDLDPEPLVTVARNAGRHQREKTGRDEADVVDDQIAQLRLNAELMSTTARLAQDRGVPLSSQDLAGVMEEIGFRVLLRAQQAMDQGRDWTPVVQQGMADLEVNIGAHLDALADRVGARATLSDAHDAAYDAVVALEGGAEVDPAPLFAALHRAAREYEELELIQVEERYLATMRDHLVSFEDRVMRLVAD